MANTVTQKSKATGPASSKLAKSEFNLMHGRSGDSEQLLWPKERLDSW